MNFLLALLPMLLPMGGTYLKGRDTNNTGADDVMGDILLAAAPVVPDLFNGTDNQGKVRKAITAINTITANWIAANPLPPV